MRLAEASVRSVTSHLLGGFPLANQVFAAWLKAASEAAPIGEIVQPFRPNSWTRAVAPSISEGARPCRTTVQPGRSPT